MSSICATRALKNIKRIRSVAPGVFGKKEPMEGFSSVIPFDILNRFHRMTETQLSKYPKLRTAAAALRKSDAEKPKTIQSHGLNFSDTPFKGTLYLAQLTFQTGSGTFSISDADMAVIQQYLTVAAPAISRYCSQYGSNSLKVSNQILKQTVILPSGKYNDDALAVWIRRLLQTQIPVSAVSTSCIIVLNPPGVINLDAVSEGFSGYHGELILNSAGGGFGTGGSAPVPYCYVNVTGQNLTVADRNRHYATTLSHEVAEMTVDPFASHTNPEVCDGCAANCLKTADWHSFFALDTAGNYSYAGSNKGILELPFDFYIAAIAKPSNMGNCPAPDNACAYGPSGFSVDTNELHVVGVGNDGKLWHTIRDAALAWTGFGFVEGVAAGGPATFTDISCGSADGQALALQLVGVGSDGNLWHTIRNAAGGWDGFGLVEEVAPGGPPSFRAVNCAGTGPGLQVVGVGSDGNLWHTIRSAAGGWTGFGLIKQVAAGGPHSFIDVSCTGIDGRTLQVIGVGYDGMLWETVRNADLSWAPFVRLESLAAGGPGTFKRVSCAGTGPGLQVVGVGIDGKLWQILRNSSTGKWSGIGLIEAVAAGGPAGFTDVSCSTADGLALQVVGVGNDGNLWHTIRDAAGSWTGFGLIEEVAPGGPASFKAIACGETLAE